MFRFGRDLLAIYVQDHLAGATLGVELVRRAAAENAGTPFGETFNVLKDDIEIEALIAGVNGKRALWRALRRLSERDPRVDAGRLDELIARADRQLEALWSAHADASHAALASGE